MHIFNIFEDLLYCDNTMDENDFSIINCLLPMRICIFQWFSFVCVLIKGA